MKKRKLTPKQQLFADEYIKSGNATQSYIKAGYSVKSNQAAATNGAILLRNHKVKDYIDAKMAEIESSKIADAREVLEFYTRVLREEETEEVTLAAGDEVVTVRKKPSTKDKIAVSREIMKRYPLTDPLVAAQIKKLQAETEIAEWKRNELTGENKATDKTTLVDDIGGMDDGQDD